MKTNFQIHSFQSLTEDVKRQMERENELQKKFSELQQAYETNETVCETVQ